MYFVHLHQIKLFMNEEIREVILSPEFKEYYNSQPDNVKEKFKYVMHILMSQRVVNTKFVKILEKTEFYEMRVSLGGNEHRTILFTIDSTSFMDSKKILLLNCFLKKSTKQYKSEIQKARNILKRLED